MINQSELICPSCNSAPFCHYCTNRIQKDCLRACSRTFHPDHFFCSHCACSLSDIGFIQIQGEAYCERYCYHALFGLVCEYCGEGIVGEYVAVDNNRKWHKNCFKCEECDCALTESYFLSKYGQVVCEQDYLLRM